MLKKILLSLVLVLVITNCVGYPANNNVQYETRYVHNSWWKPPRAPKPQRPPKQPRATYRRDAKPATPRPVMVGRPAPRPPVMRGRR